MMCCYIHELLFLIKIKNRNRDQHKSN